MRRLRFLLFMIFIFGGQALAQENIRYELIHIRLDQEMAQHDFATTYNICWEHVHFYISHADVYTIPADIDLYFPPDITLCYNENGQRLIFYENGEELLEPYYTDMQVYVTKERDTLESISRAFNICIEDFIHQNEHYLFNYPYRYLLNSDETNFEQGQEVFIPEAHPCYDDNGRKLHYSESGEAFPLINGDLFTLYTNIHPENFEIFARNINVCPEDILAVNLVDSLADFSNSVGDYASIIIPDNLPACYEIYHIDLPVNELSQQINTCIEDIWFSRYIAGTAIDYYVRKDAPPCYDNNGQLLNPPDITGHSIVLDYTDTLEALSREYNICAPDLATANNHQYPQGNMNYVIPETLPCYNENGAKLLYMDDGSTTILNGMSLYIANGNIQLQPIAWQQNICPDVLIEANPHIDMDFDEAQHRGDTVSNVIVPIGSEVFIPDEAPDCYRVYDAPDEDALYTIADEHNICMEELNSWYQGSRENRQYFIPLEHEACYDDEGHRLSYRTIRVDGSNQLEITRLELEVYIVQETMSTYDLSRLLNICVNDLIEQNQSLRGRVPRLHLATFIPETRPCYDEDTGQQLIYEDETGNPLDEPIRSNELIYQVRYGDSWSQIGYKFNVCWNRVSEYNAGFLPNVWEVRYSYSPPRRIARTGGIFDGGVYVRIPTDRPPCFDYDEGRLIRYVCYDNPIDMSADNHDAIINPDGEHCYDIEAPETVIWHEGDHYLYQYRDGLMRNDFMQWCFGVEADDIIAEANNPIVYITPYDELLVRNPTRPCYIREDDDLENIHWVQYGETLHEIAWQYGKLPVWIANSNYLSNPNIIWEGQRLVIPEGVNLWHLLYRFPIIGGLLTLIMTIRYLYRRQQGLTGHKKKRKRDKNVE